MDNDEIKGWAELREQIKNNLGLQSKTLPLSPINQLLVIRNFATLRLKGLGWIAASQEDNLEWNSKMTIGLLLDCEVEVEKPTSNLR